MLKRIDSDGLRVKFNGVSGCTSRQFCRELEEVGEIHLRRQLECKAEHSMHIQEFAGVDHEALLGLHRYAHGSPRWLIGLLGRGVWRGLGFLVRLLRCCCRICCNKKTNRVIRDEDGHERFLDPDSESEAEGDEAACQGVRVGLMVDGEMRPLAPDGCNDMATQEETTLLDGDIEVSDVRPPGPGQLVRIPLCAHHRQVYQSAALKRPDLPQRALEQEDVMGRPVWLKVRLTYEDGNHEWILCLGELAGYTPGGVRGDEKLEIYVTFLDNTIIVDPKYLEDMVDIRNLQELEPAKAQLLVKEVPQDAAGIGLDVKGYIVPELLAQRLQSWEGRTLVSGRRLSGAQLVDIKKNLSSMAELGMDHQVRGRKEGEPLPKPETPRRRSRSRSHSLARAMREEDETRQEEEPDVPVEVENEEVTGDGVIEAYMTATCPGQTHQEAIDTVQMIFEVDVQTLRNLLRTHIRRNCGKQNESVEVAIRILKKVTNKDHKDEKDEHLKRDADPERSKPVEKKGQAAHERLFPSCYEGPRDDGSLIRPAEATSKLNPLISNDGVVGQLFGLGNRIDEASTRAGAGGDDDEAQMGARVVHALEGLRKATEGDKRGSPGTRSSIGAEESLDVYLARGCNTLTVEVCPDVTGKELFDALKRACSRAKAKLQQIEWPCLVTNGIAYGLAAMQHGGKDHTTLAPWQLSVAHAVTAKPKDFDQYEAPKDDKIEPKPRYPTHFATWLKQAKNEIRMLGSVLGLEHKKERLKALDQIEKAHEQDSDVWPEPLGRAQSSVDGGAS
ncbi:J domain-containing protein [Durusdinium trenchii]|uniref:J domain-containing protein n=1 Tax=Durusdinium trenchii TaxID=1381693 RepID=A0ABP0JB37_9DINO